MRTFSVLASLALAASALAVIPAADAATSVCIATSPDCNGWFCEDKNGDRYYSQSECINKNDIDTCQYQSDCCNGVSGFWCPERE